jgi:hypothetical protein
VKRSDIAVCIYQYQAVILRLSIVGLKKPLNKIIVIAGSPPDEKTERASFCRCRNSDCSVAFFASGIIPMPSVSQEQNESPQLNNATLPAITRMQEVPNTKSITIYNGEWEFTSYRGTTQQWMEFPWTFKSDPIYVSEYRYVYLIGSFEHEEMPNETYHPFKGALIANVVFSHPDTGQRVIVENSGYGGQITIAAPTMQIYAFDPTMNAVPEGEVITGNLTLSVYLSS